MDDLNAFERQIGEELGREIGLVPSFDALAIVRATIARSPKWRYPTMFSATKFIAASVVLVLFGGFLLAGVLPPTSEDELPAALSPNASTAAAPETEPAVVVAEPQPAIDLAPVPDTVRLPKRIPSKIKGIKRVASGTIKTPIGPARWVHLRASDANLPDGLADMVRVPGGYATTESPGQVWFSPDLLRWRKFDPPVETGHASLSASGSDYWLRTWGDFGRFDGESMRLWRSSDARTWSEIDLVALGVPEPSELDWQLSVADDGEIASNGRVTLAPLTYRVVDMSGPLGLDIDRPGYYLESGEDGSYVVKGPYEKELATVRFEETPDGLRVMRADDGQELAIAPDLDLAFIEGWADSWQPITEHRLAIIDSAGVRHAALPDAPAGTSIGVWALDEEFIAAVVRPDGALQTWTSADGESWEPRAVIGDDPDELSAWRSVPYRDDDGTWRGTTELSDGRSATWRSANFADWRRINESKTRMGEHLVKLTTRQLVIETRDGAIEMELDITPFRKQVALPKAADGDVQCGGSGSSRAQLAPGLLVQTKTADCRSHDFWFIEFERFAK